MNEKTSPPSSWHVAVNIPLGLGWAFAVPVVLCRVADCGWLITVVVTVVWALLNARIIDRYIPVLTNPAIEYLYRILKRKAA